MGKNFMEISAEELAAEAAYIITKRVRDKDAHTVDHQRQQAILRALVTRFCIQAGYIKALEDLRKQPQTEPGRIEVDYRVVDDGEGADHDGNS